MLIEVFMPVFNQFSKSICSFFYAGVRLISKNHILVMIISCLSGTSQANQTEKHPHYIGMQACKSCHEEQVTAWTDSHHDKSMQHASKEAVLGDFNNASFIHFGVTTRFYTKGDKFYVQTEGPEGKIEHYQIQYTFGFEPLQQYLIESPQGKLQALSVVWDNHKKQWYSLYPDEDIQHDDWLHWTGGGQNWNSMCADCHSTHLQKNLDANNDSYNTTWSEIDVSCEACHGAASEHLKQMKTGAKKHHAFATPDSGAEITMCGACHSLRTRINHEDIGSSEFLNDFIPSLLEPDFYHVDGQIKGEAFVYGSYLQSKMYQAGIKCSQCHDSHSLKLKAEGNALCTQCHSETYYNSQQHHRHTSTSAGAQCINCHMTGETFMRINYRRDHSFRVPRPDLSISLGVPNACNSCHQDESIEWAYEQTEKLFTPKKAPHFASILAQGRAHQTDADIALSNYILDKTKPAIVRATLLNALATYDTEVAGKALRSALKDPSPLLRFTAMNQLSSAPDWLKQAELIPLLDSPIKALRMTAAVNLLPLDYKKLKPRVKPGFDEALSLYQEHLDFHADSPSGLLNQGLYLENQGKFAQALSSYEAALKLDSRYFPARMSMARLHYSQGKIQAALDAYSEVLKHNAKYGEAFYAKGLLFAELGLWPEANNNLERAADLIKSNARVFYNLGLSCQKLDKKNCAKKALSSAYQKEPSSADYAFALANFYYSMGNKSQAKSILLNYLNIYSPSDGITKLLKHLKN